jgi:hypothetical protein
MKTVVERFAELRAQYPDLSGIDWAWEHGWIPKEEYDQAHRKAREIDKQYRELDGLFNQVAASHAEKLSAFIEDRRQSMQTLSEELGRAPKDTDTSAIDGALASDAEKALRGWSKKKAKSRYKVIWALWAADMLLQRYGGRPVNGRGVFSPA